MRFIQKSSAILFITGACHAFYFYFETDDPVPSLFDWITTEVTEDNWTPRPLNQATNPLFQCPNWADIQELLRQDVLAQD